MVIKLKLSLAPPTISGAMAVAPVVGPLAPDMKVYSPNPQRSCAFFSFAVYPLKSNETLVASLIE